MTSRRIYTILSKLCPLDGVTGDDVSEAVFTPAPGASQAQIDAATAYLASMTQAEADVPDYVTRRQFKLAVANAGQMGAVRAQVPNLSDEALIYWEDAAVIHRDSVLITELQSLLGLNTTQVDNFFRNAKDL